MSKPRVAIVIPCFNDGATLLEAVRSAEAQEPCEIVVVDDGSTDAETLGVLDTLEREGIRVERVPNAGSPAARMAGVAVTGSRYVLPLDADDCLEPGAVTVLADYLDSHEDVAAAWGDLQLFGSREHVRTKAHALDPWLVTFINDQPAGALVRRTVLLDVGGWQAPSRGLPNCSWDWNFWMTLAESGYTGRNVDAIVMRYRVREGVNRLCLSHQREIYDALRAHHGRLFDERSLTRGRSPLPWLARTGIRCVELAPGLQVAGRKRLATIICHLAYRRGGYLRPIRRRVRSVAHTGRNRVGGGVA